MLKKIFNRQDESGLAIVEIIVAATMMVIVLTASALALATGFGTAEFSAKRSQASQFAQQIIAIAKQAPFDKVALGEDEDTIDHPPGITYQNPSVCNALSGRGTGLNQIPTSNPVNILHTNTYPGLLYCQTYTISGIKYDNGAGGTSEGISPGTYTVMTDITQVATGSFDSNQAGNGSLPVSGFVPRRVTVTVWWGETNEFSIVSSYVRTPNLAECIPVGIATTDSEAMPSCNWGA